MAKFIAILSFTGILAISLVIYVQLDQPIRRVLVQGELDQAERIQIQSAVRRSLDGGLLSADLDALAEGILDLGWPRNVAIRREWPSGLDIQVEKPTVVARWQDAYLASDGSVIRLPTERRGLPRFDCSISEPRRAMEIYHRLSEIVAGAGLGIERLTENPFGEWDLTFTTPNGRQLTVRLGSESTSERLERFVAVYRQHLAGRADEIEAVDARYDNGVAVSWTLESELVAAAEAPRSESI
jgi:cell division protein FtsQ